MPTSSPECASSNSATSTLSVSAYCLGVRPTTSLNRCSARELDVLRTLALGHSNKNIAYALGISEATVKVHLRAIMEKLDAKDRTEAVMKALQRGTIRLR